MKKLSIITICALAVLIVSCTGKNNKSPKAELTTDVDSLSYAIGISQSNYLAQMNIDSDHIQDFLKGFYEGFSIEKDDVKKNDYLKKIAYFMGLQFGQECGPESLEQFSQQIFGTEATERISNDNFVAGFTAGVTSDTAIMDMNYAEMYTRSKLRTLQAKKREMEMKKIEQEFSSNKEEGNKFLKENATKEGVVVRESGLQYKIIKAGKGAIPELTDRVKVHYKGMFIDGTEFESSKDPVVFEVMGVVAGWTEALSIMPVGSKWTLYIPQELAYGTQGTPFIEPFSALIFEVELIGIEK